MSIRGSVTLECDRKGCHAEEVIDAKDESILYPDKRSTIVKFNASEWVLDDEGLLHCPQCCQEDPRDDAYERAAARARNNDFADTNGRDWT